MTMTRTPTEKYICTRPRLAAELMAAGHEPKISPSPWKAGMTVWIFDVNEDMTQIVRAFYERIGKPIPACMRGE